MEEKSKIEKKGKLKRELKFLEKGAQRVKTKLQKLQHDPTLTPPTSMVGLLHMTIKQWHRAKYKIHMIMIHTWTHILQ